jgi:hypothetical protein
LTEQGRFKLYGTTISPGGTWVLYARSEVSAPDAHALRRVEFWLATQKGQVRRQLAVRPGGCMELNPLSIWNADETRVFFSCQLYEGLPTGYFVVNTTDLTGQVLTGVLQADMSQDGRQLAYVDTGFNLWLVPVDSLATHFSGTPAPEAEIALAGAQASPQWSADGQWVYFWNNSRVDSETYPVSLKRLNPTTRQAEVVLDGETLAAAMGASVYTRIFTNALPPVWRLSPNGQHALLLAGGLWWLDWRMR